MNEYVFFRCAALFSNKPCFYICSDTVDGFVNERRLAVNVLCLE